MKNIEHYHKGFVFAVLITLLFCPEVLGDSKPKCRTAPPGYRFQSDFDIQPENDRFITRVINASNENQTLDMKTVHRYNILFTASKISEKPEKHKNVVEKVEVADPQSSQAGNYVRFSDQILTEPVYLYSYLMLKNNPVTLTPGTYAGIYMRSADIAIFEPLKSAVTEAGRGSSWILHYPIGADLPGPDGQPVDDGVILPGKRITVTKDMIYKILAARPRVDLEERKGKSEESPKDNDRFRLYLNLAPDIDALMVDVVCVNPQPGKGERPALEPPSSWVQHTGSKSDPLRQIHAKTLATTSWQWQVKAGDRTLYESNQTGHANGVTGSADQTDYSKPGNCPRLGKGQLVGQVVRFSKSPIFPAVEKFFAETKSGTAACAVRLKLKLYLPAEDGNPREAGELVSGWAAVTTRDYQRIRESALARMQEDKLGKQPNH